ncbi:MAG: serine/threonine-protein kinase [Acidobacteriia bacterium]|nr:serine/threonine-protein kinase [Terriglobia bacterium]
MTTLVPGTRLGPYEIQTPIGAGGMGEVYKAVDTRLDRTVAIKVLPPQWAENTEMRQRFEREAQIIASLNHPNICVLHDIGQQDNRSFLVMEFLEGETLAARISREPLPWDEALKLAIAMADALDKAHRRGVVHRDLKPSNVILTESGPKLLDFGLAKWKAPKSTSISASQAPTRTDLTTMGSILGTLQYMAPEQLEGIEADARTDIFSFGAVLHEMITGKKAFEGKSRVLLMSAIATSTPEPLSSAQPETPAALDHVVKTCLSKDPDERWQTARDLLAELEWVAEAGADTGLKAPAAPAWGKTQILFRMLPALAAILLVALAVPAWFYLRGARVQEEFRFRVPISVTAAPASIPSFSAHSYAGSNFAISPDGRSLVFSTRINFADPYVLFVRPLGSVTPQKLAGTDGAEMPFWSADGRSIGFIVAGKLKKIEATGGPPQDICDTASFHGGAWNLEGTIVFGTTSGLFRVSAQGGKPEAITKLGQEETGHYWPHFLPDGNRFLYTAWTQQASKRAVYAGTLGSKERTRVMAAESNIAYAEAGYLVFQRENTVYARAFQEGKLALTGEPVRLADEVAYSSSNGQGSFSLSTNGVLVYYQGGVGAGGGAGTSETADWQLAWIDRTGRAGETVGPQGPYRGIEVSPDGKRVAVHRHEASGGDVWVLEPRGSVTRLTFDASHHNSMPVWSPDGNRIVYSALQKGKWGLYQTLSSGSGKEELLFESETLKAPMSWSPDGKRIVFWVQDPKTGSDLWVLPLEGDKKPAPLISTPAIETHGQISPDGKWIAYTSNSTGRNEVYVQPFPAGSGRYQISNRGGDWPRWKRDSKELLYHAIAPNLDSPAVNIAFTGPLLSATVIAKGDTLEPDSPKELVRMTALNIPHSGGDYQPYAISADGERILYPQLIPASSTAGPTGSGPGAGLAFSVAMHWAK